MGPGSSILLKTIPNEAQLNLIKSTIETVSLEQKEHNFWVNTTQPIGGSIKSDGSPFSVNFENITNINDHYENNELAQIVSFIGYKPEFSLNLSAMCNGDIDHKILGELTLYLAKTLNGHIDFGGVVFSLNQLPWYRSANWYLFKASWPKVEPYFKRFKQNISGNIFTVHYKTASGKKWAYHISDTEFLESWLKSPEFHMIK